MRTLDVEECAEFLKVERKTVLKLAGAGVLPGARIGRAWVFLEDALVEYLRTETGRQMRERQAKAAEGAELEAASARIEPKVAMDGPTKRGRKRKSRPDLSLYDIEVWKTAGAK